MLTSILDTDFIFEYIFKIMGTVLTITLFQSLITAILIYLNKKFSREDFFLSLLFIIIFIHILYKTVLFLKFNEGNNFEQLHGSFTLITAPLLYFHTLSILKKKLSQKKILIHIFPFFIIFILNIIIVSFSYFSIVSSSYIFTYHFTISILAILSFVIYAILSIKLCKKYDKENDCTISLKLKVASVFAKTFIIFAILTLLNLVSSIFNLDFSSKIRTSAYLTLLVMLVYVLHNRLAMFFNFRELQTANIQKDEKYCNYLIEEKEMQMIKDNLHTYFNTNKEFLDPHFTLDHLSSKLKISKLKITQTLNVGLETNFYTLLNSYRIVEAKKLIEKSHKTSLTNIGYDCGFKNKSTFYKYFKEITGCTPTGYKNSFNK